MSQINNLKNSLDNLESQNLRRKLTTCHNLPNNKVIISGKEYISFCSNDYLSLGFNKYLHQEAKKAIEKYGSGGLASRYIYGDNELYQKLENKIAKINQKDAAIIFGSGYLTNIGIIPALFDKNDLILADKLSHSCLIEGMKLSGAKSIRFIHNNLNSLENFLKKYRNNHQKCLIITENVFSMDGDLGKINEFIDLSKKYDCFLLSDNAHGLGIINQKYDDYDLHLKAGTFSKSCAGYGGYVCANKIIIDYLRNFSKSAIYSTALPPSIIASNLEALKIIEKGDLTKKLWKNINYFCNLIDFPNPQSAIIPIIIGDNKKTLEIAKKLQKKNLLISAIRPPTVANGTSRIRITITSGHTKNNLELLAENIKKLKYSEFLS